MSAAPSRRRDRFSRIPERVKLDRKRRELSFYEHAVLVLLVEDADYPTGEVIGTLRSLADAWDWPQSTRQLGRVLYALRERGEIEFEVDERQRKPWCIKVVGDGFGLDCDKSATPDPPFDVAVSATGSGVDDDATHGAERDSDDGRLRHGVSPDTATATATEDQDLAADKPPLARSLVWDALEAVADFKPATKHEASDFGETVKQIKAVLPPDASYEDVLAAMQARREAFARKYDEATFTHRVLRNRWGELGEEAKYGRFVGGFTGAGGALADGVPLMLPEGETF